MENHNHLPRRSDGRRIGSSRASGLEMPNMLRPLVDSGCLARMAREIAPGTRMITDRAANPQFTKKSEAQHDNRHNHHGADNGQSRLMQVGDAGPGSVLGRGDVGLG